MAERNPTTTSGRERPIPFSGPEVRAILAGTKTQTRRLMRRQPKGRLGPWDDASEPGDVYMDGLVPVVCVESRGRNKRDAGELSLRPVECPYGVPGDRLWVREAWKPTIKASGPPVPVYYRADTPDISESGWQPSIHMPRWASRLTLEILDVRVQRLQDISEEDAKAEGFIPYGACHPDGLRYGTEPRDAFRELWDSLNAKRALWASNPYVWAITFRRHGTVPGGQHHG